MKQLRNAILRSFILYFFGLSIIGGLIEELFASLETLVYEPEYQVLFRVIGLILQLVAVFCFSYAFYRSLDKKIEEQSQKIAKQQNTLFANIAHDLKTPLTSITGFSKALSEDIVEPEERAEASSIIYQKSLTANELLDLMFQYTKLNAAEYSLNRQECAVNFLLKEAVADNYDMLEQQRIELVLDLPEEPVMKSIDKIELRRVFNNLLINACKHNPPESQLAISIIGKNNQTKIIFADNGTPIPPKDREKLFQPFVSENETERNFQGSGLGLAIVKTIIDKHGFTIELLDDEKYTKKFVITL
ncbi:HAMP domain-containing sensor histidine kinase [Enterococcus hulanensis]|uniref:histidine kinase n=1 Tax=Enterococcus hulanensis TaxID=2559929 RepID=A0ABU3F3S9_9ENTE|nr:MULTISPECIES: HAMP domain-containing sensor histidine kinase [Enterococcus]MBX8938660.1 HAMP domain-containing histidine kinase [Enterococcus gilvus]MDT2601789.1 HAMP domain-containing sensor histidine kinase [Enterococcus hulanensis]MDT2611174.1 HAMP domain-containing sensor histidine kinase [Enterococcus hulanensis]MDT2618540.1 HAMP domain-containing sensor histidine kinase [Enterococcus hulanensis]MDT2629685.1 HAMP domain-containing sensor histidine kinase [Enterococcus hulanensis]